MAKAKQEKAVITKDITLATDPRTIVSFKKGDEFILTNGNAGTIRTLIEKGCAKVSGKASKAPEPTEETEEETKETEEETTEETEEETKEEKEPETPKPAAKKAGNAKKGK